MTTEVCFHRCATFHKSRTMSNDPCHRHRLLSKMESANEVGKMPPPSQTQFPPWLCVLCWVAGVETLSLVLVCPCPAPPLCPVPLSSLVWAAARRVKTLAHCCGLQRAEYYLVRARHNHPRSNSSVLCDKMRLDMRHRKNVIQVQSKFTIKNCLEV